MRRTLRHLAAVVACVFATACETPKAGAPSLTPHNVIIFVADGLRYGSVNPTGAPAFAAVRAEGVDFANSHSIYPTLTTVNAAALATGHYPGDAGDFANAAFAGEPPLPEAFFARVVFYEENTILRGMNARFGGNYLHEQSLLEAAMAKGYAVAALGKTGPTAIQDLSALSAQGGIVIDGSVATPPSSTAPVAPGNSLPSDIVQAIAAAQLPPSPPPRNLPNRANQDWYVKVATVAWIFSALVMLSISTRRARRDVQLA